eukprot:gene11105-12270_t
MSQSTIDIPCYKYGYYYDNSTSLTVNIKICVAICAALVIPTTLLNASILAILIRDRGEYTTSKSLRLSLVVADLAMGLFTQPSTTIVFYMILRRRPDCRLSDVTNPISFHLAIASFVTLTSLAVDRYVKFLHPFKYTWLAKKPVMSFMIAFAWLIPLWPVLTTATSNSMIVMDRFIAYFGAFLVLVNIFCNIRAAFLIRKQRKQIRHDQQRFNNNTNNNQVVSHYKHEASLVVLAILLLISTVMCYLPVICLSAFAARTNRYEKGLVGYLTYWAWTIACVNPLMNPIVKIYRMTSLRKEIIRLYFKCFRSSRQGNNIATIHTNTAFG